MDTKESLWNDKQAMGDSAGDGGGLLFEWHPVIITIVRMPTCVA